MFHVEHFLLLSFYFSPCDLEHSRKFTFFLPNLTQINIGLLHQTKSVYIASIPQLQSKDCGKLAEQVKSKIVPPLLGRFW